MTAPSNERPPHDRGAHRPTCGDYILFDEGVGRVHEVPPALRRPASAMGLNQSRSRPARASSATQIDPTSQLASFSQASQIHHQGSPHQGPSAGVSSTAASTSFFMLHALDRTPGSIRCSPSPRCRCPDDEGALRRGAVGRPPSGLGNRAGARRCEAIQAASSRTRSRTPARRWFFDALSCPTGSTVEDRARRGAAARNRLGRMCSTDDLARQRPLLGACPRCRAGTGFNPCGRPGYAITDPNKLILLTPGFDRGTGTYADYGIPGGRVVAQYLRENRV